MKKIIFIFIFCSFIISCGSKNISKLVEMAQKGDDKAKSELAELANEGNLEAQYQYGIICPGQEGIKWLEKATNNGNINAMKHLGLQYAGGPVVDTGKYYRQKVPIDYNKSLYWYEMAAEHDDVDAAFTVALYYSGKWGVGIPYNKEKAMKWMKKAAELGDEFAIGVIKKMADQ